MHRGLYIQEILHLIFGYIDTYECSPIYAINTRSECSLRTLAALTYTCKTFKEPALDILWRDIPGPHYLVQYLLPDDAVQYTRISLVRLLNLFPAHASS